MGLSLSSIGLGTYLGDENAATDAGYEASVATALSSGINVFDTAINYRGQRSERAIGRALARAFAAGVASRDEVFVSTKGGYLPHDAEDRAGEALCCGDLPRRGWRRRPRSPRAATAWRPLPRGPIERSRPIWGSDDRSLLSAQRRNAAGGVGREIFRGRYLEAIEALEGGRGRQIGAWGLATWNGLRVPPEHPEHLSLPFARTSRGRSPAGHHFGPCSCRSTWRWRTQSRFALRKRQARVPARGLRLLDLAAFGSASLLRGGWPRSCPSRSARPSGRGDPGAPGLQFAVRPRLTSALVGCRPGRRRELRPGARPGGRAESSLFVRASGGKRGPLFLGTGSLFFWVRRRMSRSAGPRVSAAGVWSSCPKIP
jgi:hypothetical protein